MAVLHYNTGAIGGAAIANVAKKMQELAAAAAADLRDWIDKAGPTGLQETDFGASVGDAQGINDTVIQVCDDYLTWWGDGSGGTNREKVARVARGG